MSRSRRSKRVSQIREISTLPGFALFPFKGMQLLFITQDARPLSVHSTFLNFGEPFPATNALPANGSLAPNGPRWSRSFALPKSLMLLSSTDRPRAIGPSGATWESVQSQLFFGSRCGGTKGFLRRSRVFLLRRQTSQDPPSTLHHQLETTSVDH